MPYTSDIFGFSFKEKDSQTKRIRIINNSAQQWQREPGWDMSGSEPVCSVGKERRVQESRMNVLFFFVWFPTRLVWAFWKA